MGAQLSIFEADVNESTEPVILSLKTKVCVKCKNEFPVNIFKRGNICSECIKKRHREYKNNLPEWKKEENKMKREIRKKRSKRLWNYHKVKEGCFHCKSENLSEIDKQFGEAYDSHHVYVGDKKTTKSGNFIDISSMITKGYPWDTIQKELKYCVTLCKTCHSLWHQNLVDIDFTKWERYDASKPLKF